LEKEHKAMLLFTNDKSLKAALTTEDISIKKIFKLKKYIKKEIENKKTSMEYLKNKFFDNETIELLKNKRFMSNLNYMDNENKVNKNNKDNPKEKNEYNKKIKIEENFNEDEEINKKDENNYNDFDLNLDLENMEKLLFAKINSKN
jgi:hypothetical protein